MVRLMMNKIFQSIETELNSLIALGDKIDSFNSLYMLVKMSHHVWTAENVDPASYLSTTLGNVLVTVKRNFDKCIVRIKDGTRGDSGLLKTMLLILNSMFGVFLFFSPTVGSNQADGGSEDFQEKQSWHPAFCHGL